jgi:hypothetical protein
MLVRYTCSLQHPASMFILLKLLTQAAHHSTAITTHTTTTAERAAAAEAAEAAEAERELRTRIRTAVAGAAAWQQRSDAYGRVYYEHSETGEAAYELPAAAAYRPPLGRDELGNPCDAVLQVSCVLCAVCCVLHYRTRIDMFRVVSLLHTGSGRYREVCCSAIVVAAVTVTLVACNTFK